MVGNAQIFLGIFSILIVETNKKITKTVSLKAIHSTKAETENAMKKTLLILFVSLLSWQIQSQDYNLSKGYIASGYDVVAYFDGKAVKGKTTHETTYNNLKFKFVSNENLEVFLKNPGKYVPQYGGFCAYAIAENGKKVDINPKTFEIRNDKLYLFYNSWGVNTLKKWQNNDPETLVKKADKKWEMIIK